MSAQYILVIDQGTTGSQVCLFDAKTLAVIGKHKQEFEQIYPQPGWVEHESDAIWQSVCVSLQKVMANALALDTNVAKNILGIGVTNQRETCLGWNRKTGEVPHNAIVWQDRRTADQCERMKLDIGSRARKTTGLLCDPYFSATKMSWLLDNVTQMQHWRDRAELCLGTIDSFLIYRLTAGNSFVTDRTNASRTLLYDLGTDKYDSELLRYFKIHENMLPKIFPSSSYFGVTKGMALLPDGIPILGCIGDQQSALLGQGCVNTGEGKITFGTGAFFLVNAGHAIPATPEGLLATAAYSHGTQPSFALEGSVFIAGAAIQFIRDQFGWIGTAQESEALALSCEPDPDVLFVPAFTGLGAPYWNPAARGALLGMSRGTTKAQIMRAVLESVAFQNHLVLRLMQQNLTLTRVSVDGGAAQNDFLMQMQADCLGVPLYRPLNTESTALGAAMAVRNQLGLTDKVNTEQKKFEPSADVSKIQTRMQNWQHACQMLNQFYTAATPRLGTETFP